MAINRTVPRKLKISFLSVRKENECFPSSKNQIVIATTKDMIIRMTGKILQQYLFFSMTVSDDFNSKIISLFRVQK